MSSLVQKGNMITSYKEYKRYVKTDREAAGRLNLSIIARLGISESGKIDNLLVTLRLLEYFLNNKEVNALYKIGYVVTRLAYNRLQNKYTLSIPPNVFKEGLAVRHLGTLRVYPLARVGRNCTLQPGVFIGQKGNSENVPTIGDNVEFTPGAKVFGKLKIGNNVIVAPNSVVVHDIPDNCVVSGVPARIIKQNGKKVL